MWIECHERMPKPETPIWFHVVESEDGPGGVLHGEYIPESCVPGFHTHDSIHDPCTVTHWQPFVAPMKPDTF